MQHDKGLLRSTKGIPATPSATIARLIGRASDGGSEGMASRDLSDVEHQRRPSSLGSTASPAKACEMDEEMDERSARRNHETGCHDGPMRSFR